MNITLEDTRRHDDAPPPDRALARIGETLGERFLILRLLGVGGMATVYEAQHRNGKRVAIKILHAEFVNNDEVVGRFMREGYAANAVKHPGVVSALDDGTTQDGLPYMVLEYLEGESLDGRIERLGGPLEVPDALAVAVAVLDVLEAAHSRNIIHRDLKPDNIFLTSDGGVKVLDFGIARVTSLGVPSTTRAGIAMGTATFMPREQAHGDLEQIDARADLWALGATLYYALTGRFLFDASTAVEFLAKLITSEPTPIQKVMPSLPEPIAYAIDRALKHDIGERWSTAREMKQALLAGASFASVKVPASPSPCGFIPPTAPKIQIPAHFSLVRRPLDGPASGQIPPPPASSRAPLPSVPLLPSTPTPALAPANTSAIPVDPASLSAHIESTPASPFFIQQARPSRRSFELLGVALLCLLLGAGFALWTQPRETSASAATSTPSAAPVSSPAPTPAASESPPAVVSAAPAAPSARASASPKVPRSTPVVQPRQPGHTDLGSARY